VGTVVAPLVIVGDKRRAVFAGESRAARRHAFRHILFCPLPFAFLLFVSPAVAQKKPKPALGEKQARAVIASAPGFKLETGAIKVKEVSASGASPVTVIAEVTEAFRLASVEDERAVQDTGVFKKNRLRAVEFRTGDRTWEEFDLLAASVGAERLETARAAIEELVAGYAARQASDKKRDEKKTSAEPLTRGPLTIKSLSAMGSSEVAEVSVEARFTLSKDASGRWVVSEVSFGGGPGVDITALWPSINSQKAERARAELSTVRDALDAYRRERGF